MWPQWLRMFCVMVVIWLLLSIQTLLFACYCTTCSIEVMRSTAINHRQTTLWVWGCVIKEEIQWSSGGFWPRMVPNLHPCVFLCLWRGISAQWQINCPKTPEITQDNTEKQRLLNFIYLTAIKWILGMKCYNLWY